jgi:hypothetical protein
VETASDLRNLAWEGFHVQTVIARSISRFSKNAFQGALARRLPVPGFLPSPSRRLLSHQLDSNPAIPEPQTPAHQDSHSRFQK